MICCEEERVNVTTDSERGDFSAASSACGGEKLTLVVDEAVGGEQFEGVDLKQDSVEQKVVSRRTELGFETQTRLGELLWGPTHNKTSAI